MYTIGMLGNYVSQGVYAVAAPFEGAVDIIVVQQDDGTFKSSPWYVRCSADYQGGSKGRIVDIWVNDVKADFYMVLNSKGEAYFEKEEEIVPLARSSAYPLLSGPELTFQDTGRKPVLEEEPVLEGTQNNIILEEGSLRQESKLMVANQVIDTAGSQLHGLSRKTISEVGADKSYVPQIAPCQTLHLHGDDTENKELRNLNSHSTCQTSQESRRRVERQDVFAATNKVDELLQEVQCTLTLGSPHELKDDSVLDTVISKDWFASEKMPGIQLNAGSEILDAMYWNERQIGASNNTEKGNTTFNAQHFDGASDDNEKENAILDAQHFDGASEDNKKGNTIFDAQHFNGASDDNKKWNTTFNSHFDRASEDNKKGNTTFDAQHFENERSASENKEGVLEDQPDDLYMSKEVICRVDEMINTEESKGATIPVIPIVSAPSRWWPLSFLKARADKIPLPESTLTEREILTASQIAMESPLADEILKRNSHHQKPLKQRIQSCVPTSDQIESLKLKAGPNKVTFTFPRALGKAQVDANIYLWKWNTRIVVSDVDGTITKSDVLGQVMPLVGRDWSQSGVTRLFSAIKENGYEVLFLSARAISQSYLTRRFLGNLKQDGETLPEGPVFISPDGLLPSLYREVIRRTPHEFKISCLEEIRKLFPRDVNPFYAGFGNRDTDEISYRKVGIPKGKIFMINPKGEVMVNNHVHVKTYTSIHALVDGMFPPVSSSEQEDFNTWNYWKLPLPNILEEISDSIKTKKGQRSKK